MCVIIITNPENPISETELNAAWNVNPDGAGLAYTESGKVFYERGFMNQKHYVQKVLQLQQKYQLLLHLRISTGAGVTPQGTHPYKVGNVLAMKGETTQPVIAMNGIINGQPLETKQGNLLNDTASYIKNHSEAFNIVNKDILNIIADATAAKWAAATPKGIICSQEFQEYEGRQYSNLNHINLYDWYTDSYDCSNSYIKSNSSSYNSLKLKHLIDEKLLKKVNKYKDLKLELDDYIYQHCNYVDCKYCTGCISDAVSIKDLNQFLNNNWDIWEKINGGY